MIFERWLVPCLTLEKNYFYCCLVKRIHDYYARIGLLYIFMNCLDFVKNLTLGLSGLEVLVSFGSFVKREDGIDRDI